MKLFNCPFFLSLENHHPPFTTLELDRIARIGILISNAIHFSRVRVGVRVFIRPLQSSSMQQLVRRTSPLASHPQ